MTQKQTTYQKKAKKGRRRKKHKGAVASGSAFTTADDLKHLMPENDPELLTYVSDEALWDGASHILYDDHLDAGTLEPGREYCSLGGRTYKTMMFGLKPTNLIYKLS